MDQIDFLLTRRVDKIYPSREELEKVLRSEKKLRLYQGFDPSSPMLHVGHLAGLKKLADFQKLGHEVIFLIGDFTGMIGDPTGKKEGRKKLTHDEVLKNATEYQKQAAKVLKFGGNNPVKIMFNYDWHSKLSFEDGLNIASYITAQNIWERDMFQERVKRGEEVWSHELMYPLIQGYDSVAMDVDLEIGGSDQMFNMMIGRQLMKKMKNKNKFVLTTPLLVDKNGVKIGKTEGNAIAISDAPAKLFANLMTLPDEVIIPAFELITDEPQENVDLYKKRIVNGENPMNLKKILAHRVVEELNPNNASVPQSYSFSPSPSPSPSPADEAEEEFERVVQEKDYSSFEATGEISISKIPPEITTCSGVLINANHATSKNEVKRLIRQRAIEIDGEILKADKFIKKPNSIMKIGKKRFIKITE